MNAMRYHKPDLLLLLAFFVGIGVLATSVVQAAEPLNIMANTNQLKQEKSANWLPSFGSLDLAQKIRDWKPMISVDSSGEGLGLVRPFGTHGPQLRILNRMPNHVRRNLRAGGDNRIGAVGSDNPNAYLFLEKRW
ncbi:MAG TPA: hypothetical protein ENJ80_15670 [Gammaproteobacteria bacterium]|nr:hypothetical protein [Gammaproteobacteria bacterium]